MLAHHHLFLYGNCGCIDTLDMLDMLYSLPVFLGNREFGQDDVLDDHQLTIAHSRMHVSIILDVHKNSLFYHCFHSDPHDVVICRCTSRDMLQC